MLFDNFKSLSIESLNFFIKIPSELKPFITYKPLKVSSKVEIKIPDSFCALCDLDFKFFPIFVIMKPETGIKTNTKNVKLELIENIAIIEKTIVKGSLTISSKI